MTITHCGGRRTEEDKKQHHEDKQKEEDRKTGKKEDDGRVCVCVWGRGGVAWVRGTPGLGGRSTIFLFCVVKLGWIPPARPPFTEPLEEILLLVPGVLRPHGAPF